MKFTLTQVSADDTNKIIGTTTLDIGITEEELEEYEKLFCECGYLDKHPNVHATYMEDHLGVDHGWICPNCKKFVQIG